MSETGGYHSDSFVQLSIQIWETFVQIVSLVWALSPCGGGLYIVYRLCLLFTVWNSYLANCQSDCKTPTTLFMSETFYFTEKAVLCLCKFLFKKTTIYKKSKSEVFFRKFKSSCLQKKNTSKRTLKFLFWNNFETKFDFRSSIWAYLVNTNIYNSCIVHLSCCYFLKTSKPVMPQPKHQTDHKARSL